MKTLKSSWEKNYFKKEDRGNDLSRKHTPLVKNVFETYLLEIIIKESVQDTIRTGAGESKEMTQTEYKHHILYKIKGLSAKFKGTLNAKQFSNFKPRKPKISST